MCKGRDLFLRLGMITMKDLLILGTDVHALEMAEIVERLNRTTPTWNLLGYLTDDEKKAGKELNGYPVFVVQEGIVRFPNAFFVPAYGRGWKMAVPTERLVSLVDPSSFVSRTAKIGVGCVIFPNCYVGLNAHIGNYVFCLSGVIINHDDVIEDRVVLASGVKLAGYVRVEADCYLGQGCACKQKVKIGRGSLIGMGAVVVKDVPPNSVMVGNPARELRDHQPTNEKESN